MLRAVRQLPRPSDGMYKHQISRQVERIEMNIGAACCRRLTRGRVQNRRPPALVVRATLIEASSSLAASHGAQLQNVIDSHPLVTKSIATCLTYGVGDLMTQCTGGKGIDQIRLRNFMLSGVGSGWLWANWYDFLDGRLAATGVSPGVEATFISIFTEQFLWAPLFFGLYFLPFISAINGKSPERVLQDVKEELGPTLWANAKVWTFLNIVIYNAPLSWRSLVSNGGDLLWSAYLSFLVQDECAEDDPECEVQKQDIGSFLFKQSPEAGEGNLVVAAAEADQDGRPSEKNP